MKAEHPAIGARARTAIQHAFEGEVTQAEIAARLSMTPDALSRALKGERGFASVELVQLADLTGSDLHELITGEPDPHRARVIARHSYDPGTGARNVPGLERDERLLGDVELVYSQAGPLAPSPPVPESPATMRTALGDEFVRPLADRVEQRLGVDVIRLPGLSTCYSVDVGGRLVIVVDAVGNWFRENFGIAHELGHIAFRHHDGRFVPSGHESAANDFAAELLLPREDVSQLEWTAVDEDRLAWLVWSYGVSTLALQYRLNALRIAYSGVVEEWAEQPTQRLLRRHLRLPAASAGSDAITTRMTDAATRRFPLELRNAHLRRIAAGELGKGSLAWMLGIEADALDVEVPAADPAIDPARLGDLLGLDAP